jgi:hypothetical protein
MEKFVVKPASTLEIILETDQQARVVAHKIIVELSQ